MNRYYRIVILLMVAISTIGSLQSTPKNPDIRMTIIFDLGGVLVDTDSLASFKALGPHLIAAYMIQHQGSPRTLLHTFYSIMRTADPANDLIILDPYGNRLPNLMCKWMKGELSSLEIRQKLGAIIRKNPGLFRSSTEQALMLRINALIFNPVVMVNTRKLYTEGFDLARKCKKAGHTVGILSNWAADSFDLLTKKYPDQFSLFDPVILSGIEGHAKPEPAIYQNYTRTTVPSTCILIDDQIENIIAAKAQGMCGIHCTYTQTLWGKKPDFNAIGRNIVAYYQELKQNISLCPSHINQ